MLSTTPKFSVASATLLASLCLSAAALNSAFAQEANPTSVGAGQQAPEGIVQDKSGIFVYHVKVVQRDLDAVNYFHRSGDTEVDFKGTNLLPAATGNARVDSQRGGIHISAVFKGLTPANGFGREYLTYVLWAISADGRPQNLGEVLPAGSNNNINVTTSLQSFGMIVTAEPYYSVSQPSDVIVLQNVFSSRTTGVLEHVNVHYSLLPRGLYADTSGSRSNGNPITRNEHTPLELYEAHNAIRIAKSAGADKYAPDIMAEAATDLTNADAMDMNKHRDVKMEITYSRQAVQRAEDARITTLRKQDAERAQQQQDAKIAAQQQAMVAQQQAQQSALDAANAQAAAARSQAQADAAAAARAQAEAAKARADADAANARAIAAEAERKAKASQDDASAVREKLRAQLNSVLATSESARGLIVNLSDVLFDTGRYELKPGTQVALAKVSTILMLYPGLKVQVEGYTDSVGSDAYNQKLSENRANTVQTFLVSNGVPTTNVTAAGYGKANPVADNGTAAGRTLNRRVNLVVSGDAIGVQTTAPTPASPQ